MRGSLPGMIVVASFVGAGCGQGAGDLPDARDGAVDTILDEAPPAVVASTGARFVFHATEPATFQCSVDGAPAFPCESPYATLVPTGAHTFEVTATSDRGIRDPSPATHAWVVDTSAPTTTLLTPPSAVTSAFATFEFGSDDPSATFECSLDGATFVPCTSPWVVGPLAEGAHTLVIRAIDAAGNVSAPVEITWEVAAPPDTAIVEAPTGLVGAGPRQVRFAAVGGVGPFHYRCALDGGAAVACTSPWTLPALATGTHAVTVAAIDAGEQADATPATASWDVDADAPTASFTAQPSATVAPFTFEAGFAFVADDAGAVLECRLDGGAWAACTSPVEFEVDAGAHVFEVRATDAVGNVGPSATAAWTLAAMATGERPQQYPHPVSGAVVVGDPSRGRVLVTGGYAGHPSDQTWLWDGTSFTRGPDGPRRMDAAATFDPLRDEVVLFGGYDGVSYLSETWIWDGAAWSLRPTAAAPPGRNSPGMAFDPVEEVVVLFGGANSSGVLGDTWTWDGTTWTERAPMDAPAPRTQHLMVGDPVRGEVVLFGGGLDPSSAVVSADTWTYAAGVWTERTPPMAPSARARAEGGFDETRGVVVLSNGWRNGLGPQLGTWTWDGATWTDQGAIPTTLIPNGHRLAWDPSRGQVVALGGDRYLNEGLSNELWSWDGAAWAVVASAPEPAATFQPVTVYDRARARLVLVDNYRGRWQEGTWLWDGSAWSAVVGAAPPRRADAAAVYDGTREVVVLFGGSGNAGNLGDTWVWDGASWTQRSPVTSPTPRWLARMAHDAARGEVVLFGGTSGVGNLTDTWVWDGAAWTERTPTSSPDGGVAAMVGDDASGGVLWFGSPDYASGETWRWDGSAWTLLDARSFGGLDSVNLAFDATRGLVVASTSVGGVSAVWAWTGTGWRRAGTIPNRVRGALAYDEARAQLTWFGGFSDNMFVGGLTFGL
ncbi:MAG: kelch repeat-containing protein [Kofleriaceae bacterium]